jgi:3-oxoacyl-[acyl-carrier protein] reductase
VSVHESTWRSAGASDLLSGSGYRYDAPPELSNEEPNGFAKNKSCYVLYVKELTPLHFYTFTLLHFYTFTPKHMNFTGKTVLITGGTKGIGKATAIAFAKAGARVAINFSRDNEAAKDTYSELEGEGHLLVKANVIYPNSIEKMLEKVIEEFGQLDILVNNAGIFDPHPIDDSSYEEWQASWDKTLKVNLVGPANLSYCAAQHMMEQKSGRIVNVSSRGAFRGEPTHPAYGASKAGLNAMSQSLAQALAPHNIFVGVVAPGFVQTDMAEEILSGPEGDSIRRQSPLNRVARPEEVAHAILFLASEGAEFTTGTGDDY